ncbi:MAG: adenylosuccinate lyase, partial [Lentisphaeria bacterium]|nr:adenylosuccinate lyase [Lentisphaeria bacterium]
MAIDALSPIDGRYESKINELKDCFSEAALIKARIRVEIEWFRAMSYEPGIPEIRTFTDEENSFLGSILSDFNLDDAQAVKAIESTTNHDVKAIEYFLKEKLKDTSLAEFIEFIHFACTSEDINNLSHAIMLKDGIAVVKPVQEEVIAFLKNFAQENKSVAMLS